MQQFCKHVKAQPARISQPVRPVDNALFRSAQRFAHIKHQRVHVVRRFIAVIEQMQPARSLPVKARIKTRQRAAMFDTILHKGGNVFHVIHALAVRAFAHHRELSARYLAQKVIHVSAVLFAEDYGWANDHSAIRGVFFEPRAVFFFGEIFRAAVIVKIMDFARLIRTGRREAVDGDGTRKHDSADAEHGAGGADILFI